MRIAFNPAISTIRTNAPQTSFGAFWKPKSQQGKDTFVKQEPPKEPDDPYFVLGKEGKFKVTDYDAINPYSFEFGKLKMDEDVRSAADRSAHLGYMLKKRLDRIYGKDDYVFVSIGVKPSLIAKTFEFQGAETRYLPTSHLRRWEQSLKGDDLEAYKNFMASQGLSKEAMENSHKKYLFYGYTKGDNRIAEVKKFMIEEVGLPEDKMEFRSLNMDLRDVNVNDDVIEGYIDLYLTGVLSDKYSSLAYIPSNNFTQNTFKPEALTRYTDTEVRKFNYLIMDRLNQAEALEESPENDDTL